MNGLSLCRKSQVWNRWSRKEQKVRKCEKTLKASSKPNAPLKTFRKLMENERIWHDYKLKDYVDLSKNRATNMSNYRYR